jgi:transcriptional regulator
MFIPRSFEVYDTTALHGLVDADPFGILVGVLKQIPYASHIPFVLDRARGPNGTLFAHVASNNPQSELFDVVQQMLAIFQGPHGYISPRWYNPGNAVPTWNYAVVHAYGTPRVITDAEEIHHQQEIMIAAFEGTEGWTMDSQPESYIDGMLRGITAFEMPIERLEGKFKLSQNRSIEDQNSVIAALAASNFPWDHALAEMMRKHAF